MSFMTTEGQEMKSPKENRTNYEMMTSTRKKMQSLQSNLRIGGSQNGSIM